MAKKTVLKRPAAKVAVQPSPKKIAKIQEKLRRPFAPTCLDADGFVKALSNKLGLKARKDGPILRWASACDGSNMPGYLMKVLHRAHAIRSDHVFGHLAAGKFAAGG